MIDFGKAQFASPTEDEPPVLGYLWDWFGSLTTDRDVGFGVWHVKSSEYLAWSTLHGINISLSELLVLRELDAALVDSKSRKSDASKETGKQQSVIDSRPMTIELFDALF